MADCICKRMCWTPLGLFFPTLKGPDGLPRHYDIDPTASYAKHFEFFDEHSKDLQKAGILIQEKERLARRSKKLQTEVLTEAQELKQKMEQVDQALKDTPNALKNAIITPPQSQKTAT